MIFMMSKRVFLNVLCPLMDKSVLLNANYYIADVTSPNRLSDTVDSFEYDGDGCLKRSNTTGRIHTTSYNIQYGDGCLNPAPYITDLLAFNSKNMTCEQRFVNTLSEYSIMKAIYEQIYAPRRRGNGILIIIFCIDDNVVNFGHVIATHLAYNFGEDIRFLDPQYRPYVKGQSEYKGNQERAKIVLHDLEDSMFMMNFLQCVTFGVEEGINNMTAYMANFTTRDAIRLYELLFPNDPLPAGNYKCEDVKEIIISRMIDSQRSMQPRFSVQTYDATDLY